MSKNEIVTQMTIVIVAVEHKDTQLRATLRAMCIGNGPLPVFRLIVRKHKNKSRVRSQICKRTVIALIKYVNELINFC